MDKYKILISMIVITLSGITIGCGGLYENMKPKNMTSLFSWKEEDTYVENKKKLEFVLENVDMGRIFQHFGNDDSRFKELSGFMQRMKEKKIDVCYLTGEAEWALADDSKYLCNEIDRVLEWNNNHDEKEKFSGIVFDVEPYLTNEWKEEEEAVMKKYVNNMRSAYQYAVKNKLDVTICIPYWYDKSHIDDLEALVKDCCDEVAVMNYYRENEYSNMKNEVAFAKKYDKRITCIFEFTKPGEHDLEDKSTYYNIGIEIAQEVFDDLTKKFEYEKLYCSYHYLESLEETLSK